MFISNSTQYDQEKLNFPLGKVMIYNLIEDSNPNNAYMAFQFFDWSVVPSANPFPTIELHKEINSINDISTSTRKRGYAEQIEAKTNSSQINIKSSASDIFYLELSENNLSETIGNKWERGLDYRNASSAFIGAAIQDAVKFIGGKVSNKIKDLASVEDQTGAISSIIGISPTASKIYSYAKNLTNTPFQLLNTIIKNSDNAQAAAFDLGQSYFGKKLNNAQAITYDEPEFRQFRFRWTFVPHNREESKNIRDVLKHFKKNSLPEYNNWYINFPKVVKFVVYNNRGKQIMASDYCGISKVFIDYSGESQDAPNFHNDGMPIKIMFEIDLDELFIIDRENVDSFGMKIDN